MTYHEQQKKQMTLELREKLKTLPPFAATFLYGIEDRTSARTRLGYANDLALFFDYLTTETPRFPAPVTDMTTARLADVTVEDVEGFVRYLALYTRTLDGRAVERSNDERGKARKLYAVRSMFAFFHKRRAIENNPAQLVSLPKLHDKAKVYLDPGEVARLLDEIESGDGLTEHQRGYHARTRARDLAVITLFLGTGIRISELVGLDINHVNFEDGSFLITRKGGDEAILYFNPEVEEALSNYLDERELITPKPGHEDALFLSLQNRRLTDRAVEQLVKKYARIISPLKRISPHKLRATFGTSLYNETGDIYLVADILGHQNIDTTRKHYADQNEHNRRKNMQQTVKLREQD